MFILYIFIYHIYMIYITNIYITYIVRDDQTGRQIDRYTDIDIDSNLKLQIVILWSQKKLGKILNVHEQFKCF